MPGTIRDALKAATQYLTDHPDEARYTDSLASATFGEGLRVSVRGPGGEVLDTDMPGGVGGGGTAPSPGWFLRAAMAACVASLAQMRAAQLGLPPLRGTVEVDSESDDRGILGMDERTPAGPMSVRIAITVRGDASVMRELAEWAVAHCPVSDAVRRAVPINVEVASSP